MLTREQVTSVLRAFRAGASRGEISDCLCLTYATVCRVIRLRSIEGYQQERDTVKTLRRTEALLKNRVRKSDKLRRAATQAIRRMLPNARKRALLGTAIRAQYQLSRQETNKVMGVSSSAGCVKRQSDITKAVVADMVRYFDQNPGQGFRKVFDAILKGQPYKQCQLQEIYDDTKLLLANRASGGLRKIAVPVRVLRPMQVQDALNEMWSMDFMTDVTTEGKRFWILNVVDDFNREAVVVDVSEHRSTAWVVRCLKKLQLLGRVPKAIRSDNGMEFKGSEYLAWAKTSAVQRVYIHPKSPTENVLVERFNLTIRQEVLDRYLLTSMAEAGRMLEDWRVRYNLSRPHHSLGGLSPLQYAVLAKSS